MATGEKCVHCGADCGKSPVEWNNLFFCCNGCKQVYQLLNENKLYSYYTIEDTPGVRTETFYHSTKYEYLDKEEVKEKIYDFFDNNQPLCSYEIEEVNSNNVAESLLANAYNYNADLLITIARNANFLQSLVFKSLSKDLLLKSAIPMLFLHTSKDKAN